MTPNILHRIRAGLRHCPTCLHMEWMHRKYPRACFCCDSCQQITPLMTKGQ